MRIGIDIDDVLANFTKEIINYHNEIQDTSLVRADFKTYNLWESLGGTKEDSVKKISEFYRTSYFENIKPIQGSQEATKTLQGEHDLCIITSRQDEIRLETRAWIEQYFPKIFSKVHFSGHYFSSNGNSKTKRQICDVTGVKLLIEDNLEYAIECIVPERKILLFNQPWNQAKILPREITRVHSWEEIIDFIK